MEGTRFDYSVLALIALSTFYIVQANIGVPQEGEEFCDYDEADDAQSEDAPTEPSFCQEVLLTDMPNLYHQDDYNILAALGASGLKKTYPTRFSNQMAFSVYDELPYPVPTGASTFFMVVFVMIFTWYFGKFLHWMLRDLAKKLDLGEETTQHEHFPNINLYMLQQSRKESEVNRDVRNTWAWVANFYLLKPDDPLVKAEHVFRATTYADYQVPRDVWHIIREILKGNVLDRIDKNKRKPASSSHSEEDESDEKAKTPPPSSPPHSPPPISPPHYPPPISPPHYPPSSSPPRSPPPDPSPAPEPEEMEVPIPIEVYRWEDPTHKTSDKKEDVHQHHHHQNHPKKGDKPSVNSVKTHKLEIQSVEMLFASMKKENEEKKIPVKSSFSLYKLMSFFRGEKETEKVKEKEKAKENEKDKVKEKVKEKEKDKEKEKEKETEKEKEKKKFESVWLRDPRANKK